jgi:hypothetical protein
MPGQARTGRLLTIAQGGVKDENLSFHLFLLLINDLVSLRSSRSLRSGSIFITTFQIHANKKAPRLQIQRRRSACYAARWVAKNIVAAKLARRCEVQLAYAIGVAKPVSVMVDTFGTSVVPEASIMQAVREEFDLTPAGIIAALDLRKPIYGPTSAYGHFGRMPKKVGKGRSSMTLFTWERTDRAAALLRAVR